MFFFLILAVAASYFVYKKWWGWATFTSLCAIHAGQMQIIMWLQAIFIDGKMNH